MNDASGVLFVVATPIGNLDDVSVRVTRVLKEAALVAAEDTRRTRKLLSHIGSSVDCVSFHAQSPPSRMQKLLDTLESGHDVALVTDAGTPTISDPGGELVAAHRARGGAVSPIPGPSAVATALSVSGLPADRYTFLGFLPRKGTARAEMLQVIAKSPYTVVLFEAPGRLEALLDDLSGVASDDVTVVVTRELTKLHEETRSGTLAEMTGYYRDRPLKGEITVVIGAGSPTPDAPDPEEVEERARELLGAGRSRKDTAAEVAREFGLSRNEAYQLVTTL